MNSFYLSSQEEKSKLVMEITNNRGAKKFSKERKPDQAYPEAYFWTFQLHKTLFFPYVKTYLIWSFSYLQPKLCASVTIQYFPNQKEETQGIIELWKMLRQRHILGS